jgi:hypothetical protein
MNQLFNLIFCFIGLYDSDTGKIIDPQTGKKMTVNEGIEAGIISPTKTKILDPSTVDMLPLEIAVSKNIFDPSTGNY